VGPVIERKVGLAAFSALAVDADWRTSSWARERGLYAEVLPDIAQLDTRVDQLATRLAGYHPEAMRRMKETFWQGTEGWDALLAERAGISGELVLSDFTRKAITR
jgi:methylglutaconyl-CoA hydratase